MNAVKDIASRAIPATIGGITRGSSIAVSTMDLPRKELIANQYGRGCPLRRRSASRQWSSEAEQQRLPVGRLSERIEDAAGSALVRIATSGVTRKSSVRSIAANVAGAEPAVSGREWHHGGGGGNPARLSVAAPAPSSRPSDVFTRCLRLVRTRHDCCRVGDP